MLRKNILLFIILVLCNSALLGQKIEFKEVGITIWGTSEFKEVTIIYFDSITIEKTVKLKEVGGFGIYGEINLSFRSNVRDIIIIKSSTNILMIDCDAIKGRYIDICYASYIKKKYIYICRNENFPTTKK